MQLQRSTGRAGSSYGDGRASDTGARSYAHWGARVQEADKSRCGRRPGSERKQAFTGTRVTRRTTARLYRTTTTEKRTALAIQVKSGALHGRRKSSAPSASPPASCRSWGKARAPGAGSARLHAGRDLLCAGAQCPVSSSAGDHAGRRLLIGPGVQHRETLRARGRLASQNSSDSRPAAAAVHADRFCACASLFLRPLAGGTYIPVPITRKARILGLFPSSTPPICVSASLSSASTAGVPPLFALFLPACGTVP